MNKNTQKHKKTYLTILEKYRKTVKIIASHFFTVNFQKINNESMKNRLDNERKNHRKKTIVDKIEKLLLYRKKT